MKKIVLIIVLFTSCFAMSQDIRVGVKGGLNLSDFIHESTVSFDQRTAWHAGLTGELNFSDLFSLQLEALYSEQGAEFEGTVYPADYLVFPVFVKVYPSRLFSIDVGAQMATLLNDEVTEGSHTQSLGIAESDISLLGGITYKTKIDLYLQARYQIGVKEIHPNGDWRNQVFQLSIGYNFL